MDDELPSINRAVDESPQVVIGRSPGRDWMQVTRGVHRIGDAEDPLVADLLAWQAVLPEGAVFTHLTAARLYGWWLPPLPDDLPHFAAATLGQTGSTRSGIKVSRHKVLPPSRPHCGLRIATPAEALLSGAADVGLIDLVVLATSAVRAGDCTIEQLEIAAATRRRGSRLLRRAVPLVEPACQSAWEVLLRLLHLVCDIAVEAQHEVRDEHGALLAQGDLWLAGTHVLHEYDGGDHLKTKQQRKDLKRATRLGHADWIRRGYTSQDVLSQAIVILRDADASLGREHRPHRVRAWHELLRLSLFTPAGTARFRSRLGLVQQIGEVGA